MKYKLFKICVSLFISFILLTIFCCFFYNTPVHYTNKNGSTDYVWQKNYYYCRATEGIGYGKTNNEGLMNTYDYKEGMPIEILIMGSSHMENQFIPLKNNTATLLNNMIDGNVYNIGVSAHSFKVCISNLEAALKRYNPKYTVIEISNLIYSDDYIKNILNNAVEEEVSNSKDVIELLQKNQFIRHSITQLQSFLNVQSEQDQEVSKTKIEINEELYKELFEYINTIATNYDTNIIFMFHPTIEFNIDGNLISKDDENIIQEYKKICEEKNIVFLDMTERFMNEYKKNYSVPNGFFNTSLCEGHLNSNGHRMIAEELYKVIEEIDN